MTDNHLDCRKEIIEKWPEKKKRICFPSDKTMSEKRSKKLILPLIKSRTCGSLKYEMKCLISNEESRSETI